MTSINPNSVGNKNFKQVESDSWTSLYLPAICAVVLMGGVLFLALSFSKKSDKVAKITPPTPPAVSAPVPSTPVAALPEKPKKAVKKHRPANATYVNSEYGVSFSYPRKYSLKSGDKLTALPYSYLKPGAMQVVAVDMPENSYPESDFTSAMLNVSVSNDMTAVECAKFAGPKDSGTVDQSLVTLGDNEYSVFEQINGQDNNKSDLKFFHVFKNNACYEFVAALDTTEKPEDMGQVDRGKIFQQLEKILTTAKIKDLQATEVESADQTPSTALPIPDSKTTDANAADSKVAAAASMKTDDTTQKAEAVKPNQN